MKRQFIIIQIILKQIQNKSTKQVDLNSYTGHLQLCRIQGKTIRQQNHPAVFWQASILSFQQQCYCYWVGMFCFFFLSADKWGYCRWGLPRGSGVFQRGCGNAGCIISQDTSKLLLAANSDGFLHQAALFAIFLLLLGFSYLFIRLLFLLKAIRCLDALYLVSRHQTRGLQRFEVNKVCPLKHNILLILILCLVCKFSVITLFFNS